MHNDKNYKPTFQCPLCYEDMVKRKTLYSDTEKRHISYFECKCSIWAFDIYDLNKFLSTFERKEIFESLHWRQGLKAVTVNEAGIHIKTEYVLKPAMEIPLHYYRKRE